MPCSCLEQDHVLIVDVDLDAVAGIVAEEVVEKMPPVLLSLCKRLVR